MKNKHVLIYLLLLILTAGCRKQTNQYNSGQQTDNFADSAVGFLREHLPAEQFSALNTAAPDIIRFNGNEVAVRILPRHADAGKFILLRKVARAFRATRIDLSQLKPDASGRQSGIVTLSDLDNRVLSRYTVENNWVTHVFNTPAAGSSSPLDSPQSSISTPDNPQELDAFIVQGRRSSYGFDYYSAYWLFGQDADYRDSYVPTWDYGGGNGPSSSEIEIAPTFLSPKHPIEDIKKELKCFTIDNNAVYSVTVNVNEPNPGTRDLVNVTSNHKVGHTYLTLQEQLPNGEQVIRNVGFYPMHSAKPGSEIDDPQFGDDTNTPYSISLKISLSANEFNIIETTLYSEAGINYSLQSFNCTTAAINVLNSSNIYLPATLRSNKIFSGNNPGDLGQDIRELNLDDFSKEIGGKKVVRNTSESNSLLPPARTSNCK